MQQQKVRGIAPNIEHFYVDRGKRKAGDRADHMRTTYLPNALRAERADDAGYLAATGQTA